LVALLAGWEIRGGIRPTTVYILGAVAIVLLPVTQAFKGALSGFNYGFQFSLLAVAGGEFRTAAQNLHTVLQHDLPRMGGETFLWDVQRVFSSSLLGTGSVQSTTDWFNDTFFPLQQSGRGFSLIAEGYLNFGTLGVVGVFLLLGLTSGWLYRRRTSGVTWYAAYCMFIPLTMYVQRADMANLLSQSLKTILVPIMVLWAASQILSVCRENQPRFTNA
jgi:oligosaccharide repeat unit polymerase